tara:strand:- start:244 stop:837 length:594 start_codon:yes stop_codon:yes gene_type:complete
MSTINDIQMINIDDMNLKKYKTYTFPYLTKAYRKHKLAKFDIYYNSTQFIKIYKKEKCELDIFIKNNSYIFKKLCPAVTHLIYKNNVQLVGYITVLGKDLDNDKTWGLGSKFHPQYFLNFLDINKDILLKLLHEKHYYYGDLKRKNVIVFNDGGNPKYSFIDLENFLDITKYSNPPVNYKICGKHHWYVKEIIKYKK